MILHLLINHIGIKESNLNMKSKLNGGIEMLQSIAIRRTEYFDDYKFVKWGKTLCYIEDHSVNVKKRYFLGMRPNLKKLSSNDSNWEKKIFDTFQEAVEYVFEIYFLPTSPNCLDKSIIEYVINRLKNEIKKSKLNGGFENE